MKKTKLSSGAEKHLDSKIPIGLVHPEMIMALAEVLAYGAQKYEPNDWLKGIPHWMLYDSCMRHMMSWRQGVDIDPESGLHHLEHALTNLAMIVTQIRLGREDLDSEDR